MANDRGQPESLVILLTPPGVGAIAVMRLIGEKTAPFLDANFSRKPAAGRCVHGELRDGETVIDDPVVVLLPDGNGADISLHGGSWVVQSVLDLAVKNGFSIADANVATDQLRGIDGNSLLEKEIAAAIPQARTRLALRGLLSQADAWKHLCESDPSEEKMQDVLADKRLQYLLHPPTVAIIGAPNVGKSTLANGLFARERSITADLPGTTRDWIGEIANIDGLAVMLIDTPGIRATDDSIEQAAIERSQSRIAPADLIVLVLDATRPLAPEQAPLIAAYPQALRVINKSDQPGYWATEEEIDGLRTVATTGRGVDELRRAILAYFQCEQLDSVPPMCWTGRQRDVVRHAMSDPKLLKQIFL